MELHLNKLILVIAQSHNLRVHIRNHYEYQGYYVLSVTSAEDALKILRTSSSFSLIILSDDLPFMSADIFKAIIQTMDEYRDIPIKRITSYEELQLDENSNNVFSIKKAF